LSPHELSTGRNVTFYLIWAIIYAFILKVIYDPALNHVDLHSRYIYIYILKILFSYTSRPNAMTIGIDHVDSSFSSLWY